MSSPRGDQARSAMMSARSWREGSRLVAERYHAALDRLPVTARAAIVE